MALRHCARLAIKTDARKNLQTLPRRAERPSRVASRKSLVLLRVVARRIISATRRAEPSPSARAARGQSGAGTMIYGVACGAHATRPRATRAGGGQPPPPPPERQNKFCANRRPKSLNERTSQLRYCSNRAADMDTCDCACARARAFTSATADI